MDRLAAMARRTYSGIEQTTESWLANATALRELGLSTRESLDFTEALIDVVGQLVSVLVVGFQLGVLGVEGVDGRLLLVGEGGRAYPVDWKGPLHRLYFPV